MSSTTIFSKIWNSHVLFERSDGQSLIYIDRHLTHEVTSPIAFEGLRTSHRGLRRPDLTFAVMDHNVPTGDRSLLVRNEHSAKQMEALEKNTSEFHVTLFDLQSPYQGIVHVIGPELGLTLPGITLACGDSHTTTHGALGALAFGIGTTEGEHVFATQTLWLVKPRQMQIIINGMLPRGVAAKDVILWIIRKIGTGGAAGHAVEYTGETVRALSVEERMTLTNMAIEAGARTAIIAADEKVYDYIHGAAYAPKGDEWNEAVRYWNTLTSDPGATYDSSIDFDVSKLEPQVTWGTNPGMTVGVTERVPSPKDVVGESAKVAVERALKYMCLVPDTKITDISVDAVFIGSCTNARLSDLKDAARVVRGKKVSSKVRAMVVPGSQTVKRRADSWIG